MLLLITNMYKNLLVQTLHNTARHGIGSYDHILKIFAALANVDTKSLFYTPYDSEIQRLRTNASFQTVLEKVGQS